MSCQNSSGEGAPDPNVRDWVKATDPDVLWASVFSFEKCAKESNGLRQREGALIIAMIDGVNGATLSELVEMRN